MVFSWKKYDQVRQGGQHDGRQETGKARDLEEDGGARWKTLMSVIQEKKKLLVHISSHKELLGIKRVSLVITDKLITQSPSSFFQTMSPLSKDS